jgi:hypothetical protein
MAYRKLIVMLTGSILGNALCRINKNKILISRSAITEPEMRTVPHCHRHSPFISYGSNFNLLDVTSTMVHRIFSLLIH